MECKRCTYKDLGNSFCSFCIAYGRFENEIPKYVKRDNDISELSMQYCLTSKQKKMAQDITDGGKNILVEAVCGAGKTEIVLPQIKDFLKRGERVAFMVPRVEVAREIFHKLKKFFPLNKIVFIYGSKTPELEDIIVMTCHKAPKYVNNIDLVILDEVDAFPLSKDTALQAICFNLAISKTIFLSATPPSYLPKEIEHLFLNERFHKKIMPVPQVIKSWNQIKDLNKLLFTISNVFVYFPTIKIQEEYFAIFKNKYDITLINSKTSNNKARLLNFSKTNQVMFTTVILERGVTYKGLNVIVVNTEHILFESRTLIQIAGRVGRRLGHEMGKVLFLTSEKTKGIKMSVRKINEKNNLLNM